MYAEAVEAFLKSGSLDGAPPERIEALREAFRTSGWQGYQRKRLENLEARAKNDYVSPTTFALIYVRLGQKDMAFAWFERALEAHDPRIVRFKIEPGYDSLRDDPRYAGLIRKIGLQP
jgi:tetratricopeptide (TPR) repeat protein